MTRWPLGVVDVVYASELDVVQRCALAADDGFAHVDVMVDVDPATLSLPVGCPIAFPKPQAGRCVTPAPMQGDGMWDRCIRWFRGAPGALIEPWVGSVVNSTETVRAVMEEVPGLRLAVDTGHVADWGGDPLELLEWADHVQLRQGAVGRAQLHVDDGDGVVDFGAVLGRLEELDYSGCLSVEYFDLPGMGWGLADPRQWACDLARRVRALP